MPGSTEVQYLVLPGTNPFLLARVRWPDVAQAISAARPDWQDDIGLFDLPEDPSSVPVTESQAAAIAAAWGARLPRDDGPLAARLPLIRRMPADWSDLTPAEIRKWSLESEIVPRRSLPRAAGEAGGVTPAAPSSHRWWRRIFRRRARQDDSRQKPTQIRSSEPAPSPEPVAARPPATVPANGHRPTGAIPHRDIAVNGHPHPTVQDEGTLWHIPPAIGAPSASQNVRTPATSEIVFIAESITQRDDRPNEQLFVGVSIRHARAIEDEIGSIVRR
jgi:hypothetical protein